MIIAADEAIPYLRAAFARIGELRLFSGRSVRCADVREADALIVRSVTKVGADLLEGSSVRFVGTATIGMDHIDLDYLKARGAVVCGSELKRALRARRIEGAVLDVWEGEPQIDYDLLDMIDLGTPHIAGSGLDGKVCGTAMVLEALCRFFGIQERWDSRGIFPQPQRLRPQGGVEGQSAVRSVVLQAYGIRRDDASLRALRGMPEDAAAERFDGLRTDSPVRREFTHFVVELAEESSLASTFKALGFQVVNPAPTPSNHQEKEDAPSHGELCPRGSRGRVCRVPFLERRDCGSVVPRD
jgi:hypothetical protein